MKRTVHLKSRRSKTDLRNHPAVRPPTKPPVKSRPGARRAAIKKALDSLKRYAPGYEALVAPPDSLMAPLKGLQSEVQALGVENRDRHQTTVRAINDLAGKCDELIAAGPRIATIEQQVLRLQELVKNLHGHNGHVTGMLKRMDETIALIAVMQRDQTLSLHEQQILRALTDRHRFRPTAREAEVEVDRALREYRSPNGRR